MKTLKTSILSLLTFATACFAVATFFNGNVQKTDAEVELISEVLDKTCTFDVINGLYEGAVTTKRGDNLFITVQNGYNLENNFLGLNSHGLLEFISEPVKGATRLKIKGEGEMYVKGSTNPSFTTSTHIQDIYLEDEEITIDFGIGVNYFLIGAYSTSSIEEISIDCTCSLSEITDDNCLISNVSATGDIFCRTITEMNNGSQVSTEVYTTGTPATIFLYIPLSHIDLGVYDVAFDVYCNETSLTIDAKLFDDIAGELINNKFISNQQPNWQTFTISFEGGFADNINLILNGFTGFHAYIDNIRAVEK